MSTPLVVLILEDNEDDALLVLHELRRGGYDVTSERVETPDELDAALDQRQWDLIISDFSMPSFNAPRALQMVQDREIDTPFIIVSGTVSEEIAVASMKAGAADYFSKGNLTRFAAAVEREIREADERRRRRWAEQQLRQSEDRFAKVFHASPIAVSISALEEGVFLDVNASFERMFGYERGELIGHSALDLGIWDDAADRARIIARLNEDPTIANAEVGFRTKSGELRDCLVSFELIELGQQECILALINDITDRKKSERELQRHAERVRLLQEVTVAANEATEVIPALEFAVERVCQHMGWPVGHIFMRSRGEKPQLVSSSIWYHQDSERYAAFRAASEVPESERSGRGVIDRVLESGTPIWISGLNESHGFERLAEARAVGIQSAFFFPIFAQYQPVGVMEFFASDASEPDEALLDTIAHIATQVGRVIERDRANEELRALYNATSYLFNAETVRGLAGQIVQGVVREFDQVDCGLLLVDRQSGELTRIARTGQYRVDVNATLSLDGPGLVPKAIREGTMVYASDVQADTHYVPNVPTTRSEMVVPLRTPNGIIGALDLQSSAPDNFSRADMRVLEAFAERAASALELVRLYEEINDYAGQLELRVAERTRELQKAKDRVEAILNNSSDAIILAHANATIQQTNPRFNELFGYEVDEPFGKLLGDIMAVEGDPGGLTRALQEVMETRGYRRLEVLAQRPDGIVFPADAAFATFAVDDTVGIVCSLRDITSQKQLETELRTAFERQKQLADLKTRFVSMVSHEYRNPLAAILSSSSLLEKFSDRLTEDRKQGHLQKIGTQVKRLTELLDDVLEINKAETIGLEFRPELIDLVALCEDTADDMRQISPEHHIRVEVSGDPVAIPADVKLMRRILTNLLSNAVKYSPPDTNVTVALAFDKDQVTMRTIDQGMGIPDDDLGQLFTVFHRAANVGSIQGTGLGLSIVKQAVEVHGGDISVASTVGEGTTFTIHLPVEIT